MKLRKTYSFLIITMLFLIFTLCLFSIGHRSKVYADDIGNIKHSMFEFEAFIKDNEIVDGTAPFDKNNNAGYDSSPHNGIVRTFDTVTYPVKVTINPKNVSKLENIKIKLTGSLKNGITNGRVNAKFAVGGKELLEKEQVMFEQIYTIKQTGNSVMIPVTIEVKGAENSVMLTPKVKVEVLSVDGVDISKDKVVKEFNKLPGVKTSGKVNVKPKLSNGYVGEGMGAIAYTAVDSNCTDDSLLYQMGVSFNVTNLDGKNDLRGATFPSGEIKYHFEVSGYVDWEDSKSTSVPLNFKGKDTPIKFFDYQDISYKKDRVGHKNTLSEKIGAYSHEYTIKHSIAQSNMSSLSDYSKIEKESPYTVWNSGKYDVENQKVFADKITFNGTVKDYVIGSTFPEYRADGWRGSKMYDANEKAFSTQMFLFKSPNEYVDLGKNNKQSKSNNVFYKVKVVVDSYKDSKGNTFPLSRSSEINMMERNTVKGSYASQTTFHSYPIDRELGTPYKGYNSVSKGDASIVIGEDVRIMSDINASVFSQGGGMAIVKWNIDSFDLTKQYSDIARKNIYSYGYINGEGKRITNDYDNHKVQFGVCKSKDMSFKKLTMYGKDDYNWFDTYDEAVKHGKVGAIKNDVRTMLGAGTVIRSSGIPLKVTSKKIGSQNEKGTYNITATQAYMYRDKGRKVCVEFKKEGYNNPSLYNDEGDLLKLQSTVGHSVNFETLAVLNAQVSTRVTTDKETYYNSQTIKWKVESSLVFPLTSEFNEENNNIEIKQVLNKGLTYVPGSGMQGEKKVEPKLKKLQDGRTVLTWKYTMPVDNKSIPDIQYSTTINPYALGEGLQSSVEVESIISSPLDTRRESLRTTIKRVTITKVGMVGVFEDILEPFGPKNSDYTLTVIPYTTIEDEREVKGITVFPYNGDKVGSKFSGTTFLKTIGINANKEVEIWLNDQVISTENPNEISLSSGGWYKYDTSENQNLSNVKTIYFHIKGLLTNKDKVSLVYTMGTRGNKFRDTYYNETSLNSATHYRLSPTSNRVKYMIRANAEIELERIRIYTAKSTKGLPVGINVNKEILVESSINEKVSINLYDKETGKLVTGGTYTVGKLPNFIKYTIPPKFLEKDTNKVYEARIEGYNEDVIQALPGKEKVDTKGYTSSEKSMKSNDLKDTRLTYRGVVMTERKVGCDMKTYYEDLFIPIKKVDKIKSGYGRELTYSIEYQNDLKEYKPIKTKLMLDPAIVDSSLDLKTENKLKRLNLNEKNNTINEKEVSVTEYELPEVFVEVGSGDPYLQEQKDKNAGKLNNLVDGGKKLYIPIWIDKLGIYEFNFENQEPVGVNLVDFSIVHNVEVYAYMYGTIGSGTIKLDELLLEPVYPDSKTPNEWNGDERNWLKQ
ncbi:fusion protein (includes pXO2-28-29-30) [Clostridium sporogenes]|uniref:hypothetical protein n=1 Tax=Clostridium sporogenes TaxID=1509 RepID=UPI001C9B5956|nr:hypothetical protein [Clostridium sporogenes]MBY7071829.1 fusion protein (includes pXO2-28-29-30) [Clostridium sporogenes]